MKNFFINLSHRLFGWSDSHKVSKEWDRYLNDILDHNEITRVDLYTCYIGEESLWIGNYPFYYAYKNVLGETYLPKYSTRVRLRKMVLAFRKHGSITSKLNDRILKLELLVTALTPPLKKLPRKK